MKKTLIIVVQLIILALGILWYTKFYKPGTQTASENTATQQGSTASQQAAASPSTSPAGSGSLLSTLDDQAVFVAGLSPKNAEPMFLYLSQKYASIMQIDLLKQLKIEEKLLEQFKVGFGKGSTPEESQQQFQQFVNAIQIASKWWNGINNNLLVVSAKTFDAGKGLKLPLVMINISLNTPTLTEELSKQIEGILPGGNLDMPEVKITKVNNTYKIALSPEGYAIPAKLNIEPQKLQFFIGAEDDTPFRSSNGTQLLRDTKVWKSTAHALVPSSAAFAFIDSKKFLSLANNLVQAIPEPQRAGAQEVVNTFSQSWKPMDGVFFSQAVGQRAQHVIEAKTCSLVTPEGGMGQMVKDFLSAKSQGGNSEFPKMYSNRTIFSLGLNLSGIEKWFKPAVLALMGQVLEKQPEVAAQVTPYITMVEGYLTTLSPRELSVTVDSPMGMPIPDGVILLKSAKLQGAELTKAVQKVLGEISVNMGQPGLTPQLVDGEGGVTSLRFDQNPTGMPIAGLPLSNNHFAFLMNEGLAPQVDTKLKNTSDNLSSMLKLTPETLNEVRASDGIFYFNSEAIIEMAKPFIPMILPGLNGQLESEGIKSVDINQVENIIKQINGAVLTTYNSEQPEENTICRKSSLIFAEINPAT